MRRAFALMLVLTLAGCVSSKPSATQATPSTTTSPTPSASIVARATDASANLTLPPAWSAFSANETGGAGDWLVLYKMFPQPLTDGIGFSYELDARAAASGRDPLLFIMGPSFLTDAEDGGAPGGLATFDRQGLMRGAGGVVQNTARGNEGYGTSDGLLGVFVAIAADAPWTLSFSFQYGKEAVGDTTPEMARGQGAMLAIGADRSGVPDGPLGVLHLEAPAAQGWTHLQVVNAPVEPDAIHQYDYALPDGTHEAGLGQRAGVSIPVTGGGSSSESGLVDYFGGIWQPAGTLSMDLTYAAGDTSVDLGYASLPGARPALGAGPGYYSGTNWPFPDSDPPG